MKFCDMPYQRIDFAEAKKELSHIYYKYVCRLSERINCDEQMLKSVFDLFISAAVNCVIWDEKEKSQMQLEFIYSVLPQKSGIGT